MRSFFSGCLLLVATLAFNAAGRAAEPAASLRDLLDPQREVLPGGVALVLAPDATSPIIATCIAVKRVGRGPVATSVLRDGRAARITERRSGRTIRRAAGHRMTVCHTLPSNELALGLWLARWHLHQLQGDDRYPIEPTTPDETARSRVVTLGLEGARAPRTSDSIPGDATRAGAVVSLAGGFDVEAARSLARATLGSLGVEGWKPTHLRPAQSTERLSVVEHPALGAPHVHWGWTFSRGSEALPAHVVVTHVLADGEASRLGFDVVRRRRHADQARPWLTDLGATFTTGISLAVSPRSSIDKAQRFVAGALKHLRLVGPSEAELARFRARWMAQQLTRFDAPRERAAALAEHELLHGNAELLASHVLAPLTVDREEVKAAADALSRSRRCTVESYPPDYPQDDPRFEHYRLYTVSQADRTLGDVSRRVGVGVDRLAHENDWNPEHRLTPGQVLWIPPAAGAAQDEVDRTESSSADGKPAR